jgi:hypothetical protein
MPNHIEAIASTIVGLLIHQAAIEWFAIIRPLFRSPPAALTIPNLFPGMSLKLASAGGKFLAQSPSQDFASEAPMKT